MASLETCHIAHKLQPRAVEVILSMPRDRSIHLLCRFPLSEGRHSALRCRRWRKAHWSQRGYKDRKAAQT